MTKSRGIEESKKRMQKYVFENSEYTVVVPSSEKEIKEEGNGLRIQMDSYLGIIAKGRTNIVFISDKGELVQVRGFLNAGLCSSPIHQDEIDIRVRPMREAIPFVKEWMRETNLKPGYGLEDF